MLHGDTGTAVATSTMERADGGAMELADGGDGGDESNEADEGEGTGDPAANGSSSPAATGVLPKPKP